MTESLRRVITGIDPTGKSVFVSDGSPTTTSPRGEIIDLWRIDAPPTDPSAGHDPPEYRFPPAPQGNLFRIVVLPTQAERIAQYDARVEGIPFPSQDPRDPDWGMHSTPTIDYITVVSGAVRLRLDDGAEVELRAGDCAIQRGTRHTWLNTGAVPCVLSIVMIGVQTT
jgi:mannose-6-phosphate isomerase-like protein (cupin superfamily)